MFKPGDIYEDCANHPVLCTNVDGDDIEGMSLIDGSTPRSCSINHCGVSTLTSAQVSNRIRHRELFLVGERYWRATWDGASYYHLLNLIDQDKVVSIETLPVTGLQDPLF